MNETPISIWFPYQEENLKKQSRNEKVRKQLWSLSIDTLFSDFINRCHIFYLRCFLKSRNHMSTCIDFKVFFKCAHFRKFFSSFEFRIQCSSPAKYYLFFFKLIGKLWQFHLSAYLSWNWATSNSNIEGQMASNQTLHRSLLPTWWVKNR